MCGVIFHFFRERGERAGGRACHSWPRMKKKITFRNRRDHRRRFQRRGRGTEGEGGRARERAAPWIGVYVDRGQGAATEDAEQVQIWMQEAQRLGAEVQMVETPTGARGGGAAARGSARPPTHPTTPPALLLHEPPLFFFFALSARALHTPPPQKKKQQARRARARAHAHAHTHARTHARTVPFLPPQKRGKGGGAPPLSHRRQNPTTLKKNAVVFFC